MNKQSVIALVVVVAVGSFGLGWWIKPIPEVPTAQTGSNATAVLGDSIEKATPLTEMEQVALDFFIAAHIHADHEKIRPLVDEDYIHPESFDRKNDPGTVYVGTEKTASDDENSVYIFYPRSGHTYRIKLADEGDGWKVWKREKESVGRGGDYTFEEFEQTELYQHIRVYEWKEAKAE